MKELPLEELQETWKDDSSSGEYISVDDTGQAYYHGRPIVGPKDGGIDFEGIRAWCDKERYWPNVWQSNERGNVSLYTLKGEYLGGLV